MSKKKKILLTILAVILVIAATFGIAYAAAPRDFLQLILSDSAYTKFMLAKNLTTKYPAAEKLISELDEKNAAFEASGTISASFDKEAFGDQKSADAVSDYVSSLKLDANLSIDGTLAKASCNIKDSDAAVITVESAADPSGIYMNVNQFGLGWLNMNGKTDTTQYNVGTTNQTYENIVESKADDTLRKAVYKYAEKILDEFPKDSISIASKKELQVGSLQAKGDVITVVLTADEFKNCVNVAAESISSDKETFEKINSCVPAGEQISYEDYQAKISEVKDKIIKKADETGLKTANLDFFVNRRNEIVALKLDLSSESVTNKVALILEDTDDRGFSVSIENDNETVFLLDILKSDKKSGKIVIQKAMENGPLKVEASYSDLVIKDDELYGHIVTKPFELPGENDLGAITLDLTITGENSSLGILLKADIENFGTTEVSLKAEKVEFKSFTVPKASEISPYNHDTFRSAAVNYFLKDMPDTHPAFRAVYTNILTSSINGAVGDLISALTGDENVVGSILGKIVNGDDLSNAIGGIIDSAIKGDTSGIGNIVNDFFKAFGLKGSD